MATISIVLGRNLAAEELTTINDHRKIEFNSQNPISPAPDNENWLMPYFLVREDGKLVAFARLHEVKLEFMGETYDIYGIATVIAIVKSRGYGQQLMAEMKRFILQNKKTAIGFCYQSVSGFYEKCGYSIVKRGKSRFAFMQDGHKLPQTDPGDDVLYLDGQDMLMEKVNSNPEEQITAYMHPW